MINNFNKMNFALFTQKFHECMETRKGFDSEWMHDFYEDFMEDYKDCRHTDVKEWCKFFFQEVTSDTHDYYLKSR